MVLFFTPSVLDVELLPWITEYTILIWILLTVIPTLLFLITISV